MFMVVTIEACPSRIWISLAWALRNQEARARVPRSWKRSGSSPASPPPAASSAF